MRGRQHRCVEHLPLFLIERRQHVWGDECLCGGPVDACHSSAMHANGARTDAEARERVAAQLGNGRPHAVVSAGAAAVLLR